MEKEYITQTLHLKATEQEIYKLKKRADVLMDYLAQKDVAVCFMDDEKVKDANQAKGMVTKAMDQLGERVLSLLAMVGAMELVMDSVEEIHGLDSNHFKEEVLKRYVQICEAAGIKLK